MRRMTVFMTPEDFEQAVRDSDEKELDQCLALTHFADEDGDLAHAVKQEDMDRFIRRVRR